MKPVIVGVDVDGVLADHDPLWAEYVTAELKKVGKYKGELKPCTQYGYSEWGLSPEDVFMYTQGFVEHEDFGFDKLEPIAGGKEVLEMFRKKYGVHIVIKTARGGSDTPWAMQAQSQTSLWLKKHGIIVDSVAYNAKKTMMYSHFQIDDAVHVITNAIAAGTMPVLFDASHNQDCHIAPRAMNWEEVAGIMIPYFEAIKSGDIILTPNSITYRDGSPILGSNQPRTNEVATNGLITGDSGTNGMAMNGSRPNGTSREQLMANARSHK